MTESDPTDTAPVPAEAADEPVGGGVAEADRSSPLARSGVIALAVVSVAWAVVMVLILARPVFITHDSLSNNVHVWWIADQLWSGSGVPMKIASLANGEALTFPYASIPWLSAAVVWPVLGDRAVSLWLVLGFVGTVGATFWTFPSLRRGWWAVATLTNPALVISPLLGQLPFLWSMACFITAMGMWRRGRVVWAVGLTVLAQIIHPAVTIPIAAMAVVIWLPFERRDRRVPLVGWWLVTVALSAPAVWAVFQSPVVGQTSATTQLGALLQTVAMRALVVGVPFGLVALQQQQFRRLPAWTPAVLSVVFVALQWPMYTPFGMDFGWGALRRNPDPSIDAYAGSSVRAGETYRVLSGFDGKYGLYAVARSGGVLDAEFFPEGLHRGPFSSVEEYSAFLRERRVDHVVAFPSYGRRYRRTNEPALLDEFATLGCVNGVSVTRGPSSPEWSAFDVRTGC